MMTETWATLSTAEERVRAVLAQPDPALLAEIRKRTWTGHNIPLSASEATISTSIPLMTNDERTSTIKALVAKLVRTTRPLRLLDLGSLEGGLSFEMAREGWDVTGIEGRDSNFEKAELIRRYFGLENLRFQLRDVKSLDPGRDGTFDVILCCGLLYHLDNPFAFFEKLATILAPDGLLFVDTHVAPGAHAARFGTHAAHLSGPA